MTRPPDALEPAGDRLRALDLDDEIDGAHVDAELERRGRDQAGDPAGLELVLDLEALLAGDRAVVGAGDLLAGELVQPQREALGEAAAVDEDDRRPMRPHELEHGRVDRGPDRAGVGLVAGGHLDSVGHARAGQVGRPRPARACPRAGRRPRGRAPSAVPASTSSISRPVPATKRPISSSGRWVAERPMRCGERSVSASKPLEREHEVRAALRPRHGVDLVDDHRLDRAQQLARARGEEEEERLGRRDQDVGRRSQHLRALALRRVAGAHAHTSAATRARRAARRGSARCRS